MHTSTAELPKMAGSCLALRIVFVQYRVMRHPAGQ